jgi:TPR repeat protein
MYFRSPIVDTKLLRWSSLLGYSFTDAYSESITLFDEGDFVSGHQILAPLLANHDHVAQVLFASFSLPEESWSDFEQRHVSCLVDAAESKNPFALYAMGVYYDTGQFVEYDQDKAFLHFKCAAELGIPHAKYIYGVMLFYGTGGANQDRDNALKLLREASDAGEEDATNILKKIQG